MKENTAGRNGRFRSDLESALALSSNVLCSGCCCFPPLHSPIDFHFFHFLPSPSSNDHKLTIFRFIFHLQTHSATSGALAVPSHQAGLFTVHSDGHLSLGPRKEARVGEVGRKGARGDCLAGGAAHQGGEPHLRDVCLQGHHRPEVYRPATAHQRLVRL